MTHIWWATRSWAKSKKYSITGTRKPNAAKQSQIAIQSTKNLKGLQYELELNIYYEHNATHFLLTEETTYLHINWTPRDKWSYCSTAHSSPSWVLFVLTTGSKTTTIHRFATVLSDTLVEDWMYVAFASMGDQTNANVFINRPAMWVPIGKRGHSFLVHFSFHTITPQIKTPYEQEISGRSDENAGLKGPPAPAAKGVSSCQLSTCTSSYLL